MNQKIKNTKGITLIALVITIVVLLILAAVSITVLFGEGGMFTTAKQSKEYARIGSIEDEIMVWKSNNYILSNTEKPIVSA